MRRSRLALFNSMSQRKEAFKVVPGEAIKMFVCGPTVQSFIHAGHARTYVAYDVLVRYLTHLGLRVNFLVNITDVDDRITEAARRERTTTQRVVERYSRAFFEDLRNLRVDSITSFEPVSKHVSTMIDQVSVLIENGYAYVADGVVYFDTSKYPYYGDLSHQSKDDLSLRPLELTPNKRNLLDFSLWRPIELEKGRWDSPWGRGSPGWHIEDTAVTLTNFGPQYDIHGGAYELIYPHHEAELAQGESLTGIRPLVRFWVHTGLVNFSGRKMSKSVGNTSLVRELLRRCTVDELRYYLLSWHYREDVEFSFAGLETAKRSLAVILSHTKGLKGLARKALGSEAPRAEEVREALSRFYAAMDDDIDTPRALEWVQRESVAASDPVVRYAAFRIVSDVLGVGFVA